MKPIGIEVRGMFLDVTGSIRFKFINPMFEHDSIPGISVFPFELPGTPNNKRLLDYFNLAEDSQYINTQDAVIYLYGNVFLRGGLKYKWVKDKFEAEFSQVMSLYENKDNLLNTIDLGSYDMLNQDGYGQFYKEIEDRTKAGYGTLDYVMFPMYNPSLFNNKDSLKGTPSPYTTPFDTLLPEQYAQYMNYWDYHEPNTGAPDIQGFWFNSIGSPDRTNDLVISPSYYVVNLLKKLFDANGFGTLQSPDFINVGDIPQLVITTDKFFRMRVNLTAPGGTRQWTKNFIDFADYIFHVSDFLPDITLIQFLNAVKNTFNLSFFFGQVDGTVEIRHNESLLTDESYVDWTHKCFLLHEKEAEIIDSFTLKYTPSDDALNSYIRTVTGKTILSSVWTLSSLPGVSDRGKICLVKDENVYYEQDFGLSGLQWWRFSDENINYIVESKNELESGSDTWHVGKQNDQIESVVSDQITPLGPTGYSNHKVWRIPQGEFAGNSNSFGLAPKTEGYVRFLFYRYMQNYIDHYNYWIPGSTTPPQYPYGTNDEYDPQGSVIGSNSLLWNGSLGLYEKWWSKWIEFLKVNVPIRRAVALSIDDLLNFDFKKKKMIDGTKYFWKDGDVVISNEKGIEAAVADFLKVTS